MDNNHDSTPRHHIINSRFDVYNSWLQVMCLGMRFDITINSRRLQGTGYLTQYSDLVNATESDDDDDQAYEALCDWILAPCVDCFKKYAEKPLPNRQVTLQEYFVPVVINLEIVVTPDGLIARRSSGTLEISGADELTTNTHQLPPFPDIQRFLGSDFSLIPDEDNDYLCHLPEKVRGFDGKLYHFKALVPKTHLIREMRISGKIHGLAEADETVRCSRPAGIVTTDDGEQILGLLVHWIPSIGDMSYAEVMAMHDHLPRWRQQVLATLKVLHEHGVIWAGAYPHNVWIDVDLNAWLVDFGGGWNEDRVPRKVYDTVEGDLSGVDKIFALKQSSL